MTLIRRFFTSKHRLHFWKYSYCAPEQWPQSIKWIRRSFISEPVSMVRLRSFLGFLFCSSLFLLLFSNYAGAFESICRSTAHKHVSFMHEVSKNTSSCHIIISLQHTLREQRHFTPRAARTECRYVWEVLTASSQHHHLGATFLTWFPKVIGWLVRNMKRVWRTYEDSPRGLLRIGLRNVQKKPEPNCQHKLSSCPRHL